MEVGGKKTNITSFFRARGAYMYVNDKTIIQTSDDRVRMGVGHLSLKPRCASVDTSNSKTNCKYEELTR